MRSFLILIGCIGILMPACKPSSTPGSNCQRPTGTYINLTVLNACPEKMPVDIPHYALEFVFKGEDTVWVDNGFEKFPLKYAPQSGCEFKITGASLFGDMVFEILENGVIQLADTAFTKANAPSFFEKTDKPERATWNFEQFFNTCLLAGYYVMIVDGQRTQKQVIFLPNGQMNGLRPYLGYQICYAGDCLEETEPQSSTIVLIDDKGGKETFSFTWSRDFSTIKLYSIGPPIPDIKGSRSIGPLVHELKRLE